MKLNIYSEIVIGLSYHVIKMFDRKHCILLQTTLCDRNENLQQIGGCSNWLNEPNVINNSRFVLPLLGCKNWTGTVWVFIRA